MNQATVGSDNFAVVQPDIDPIDEFSHLPQFYRETMSAEQLKVEFHE
jgi:hypothetical protein